MASHDDKKQGVLRDYWHAYGGWAAFINSRYVHASLLTNAVLFHLWTNAGWWDLVLSTLPNLLGFTLGGYAILVGSGDERFGSLLRRAKAGQTEAKVSIYLSASATFAHFILVQLSALLLALVAKGLYFSIGIEGWVEKTISSPNAFWTTLAILRCAIWFAFHWVFIYALTLALAASFAIFKLTRWRQDFEDAEAEQSEKTMNS